MTAFARANGLAETNGEYFDNLLPDSEAIRQKNICPVRTQAKSLKPLEIENILRRATSGTNRSLAPEHRVPRLEEKTSNYHVNEISIALGQGIGR